MRLTLPPVCRANGNFNFLTVVNRLKPGQSFSHYKNLAVSFHTSREDVILTMHHDISLSCQKLMRATGILIILGKIIGGFPIEVETK